MFGAIIGDIVGSVYEFQNIHNKDFSINCELSHKTDDSVLTLALIDCLLNELDVSSALKKWFRKYPNAGYGARFMEWCLNGNSKPYNSFGNGAAMRISPVGWFAHNEGEVKTLSKKLTECTHNHPEAIKAAEMVAMCIYYAKKGESKDYIKRYIEQNYDINYSYEDLVEKYSFDETCQGSVPQALFCFLISNSFEDCLRTAISIGGDSDTIAAIACSIAEAYYKVIPDPLLRLAKQKLTQEEIRLIELFDKICEERNKHA